MTEIERIVDRAKRGRVLFIGAIAALCLLVIGAVAFAIVVNFQQDTKITKVERSACAKAPGSAECQRIRRLTDRKRNIADTCIAFFKVGYPCPAPGSGVKAPAVRGGDALQPAQAGQQPAPAPAGGGGGSKPPKGDEGGKKPPKTGGGPEPESPTPASNPAPVEGAQSTPAAEVDQEAAEETSQVKPGLLDDPGGVLGDVVCTVNRLGVRVCTE